MSRQSHRKGRLLIISSVDPSCATLAVLTASRGCGTIFCMRTTVTIDPDTEALLREEVRRSGLSFKEVLNRSIRQSLLRPDLAAVPSEPLFKHPFPSELQAANFNHLADVLDDEKTLDELAR